MPIQTKYSQSQLIRHWKNLHNNRLPKTCIMNKHIRWINQFPSNREKVFSLTSGSMSSCMFMSSKTRELLYKRVIHTINACPHVLVFMYTLRKAAVLKYSKLCVMSKHWCATFAQMDAMKFSCSLADHTLSTDACKISTM